MPQQPSISVKKPQDKKTETTFDKIQRIIGDVTGNDYDDITLDADLEEDLGIEMMSEFPAIVVKIKQEFPDINIPKNVIMDCATVAELVDLIEEEQDL